MRVIPLEGKNFVAGMRWRDMHTLKPKARDFEAAAHDLDIKTRKKEGAFLVGMSKAGSVVGFFEREGKPQRREKLFTLAGSLASHLEDGIYVTPLGDEGEAWLVAITDGMVAPATDIFVHREMAAGHVHMIRSLLPGLKLFVESEETWIAPDEIPWSLSEALSKARAVPVGLLTGKGESHLKLIVTGIAAFALIGGGIYMLMDAPAPTGPSQAEIDAQNRAAYVASIQGYTSTSIPLSSTWLDQALRLVENAYAVNRFGWAFEGAECSPDGCTAIYTGKDQSPRSSAALVDSFGLPPGTANVSDDGLTLRLAIPLENPGYLSLDEPSIVSLQDAGAVQRAWEQVAGLAPLRMPNIKVERAGQPEDYTMMAPPPPGMPGVVKGVLALSGRNPSDLHSALREAGGVKATPTKLAISHGLATTPRAWRVELTYLAKK